MSDGDGTAAATPTKKRFGGAKLVKLGAAALLGLAVLVVGPAWYANLLPWPWPFERPAAEVAEVPPVFIDLPDIVTNLNSAARRPTFVKLRAKLEVANPETAQAAQAAMPRLLDVLNTYLRETRPEELRGSAGTHRLREEIVARANLALATNGRPASGVRDLLFVELVVQ
jgi:flagellar FliL protein